MDTWAVGDVAWTSSSMGSLIRIKAVHVRPQNSLTLDCVLGEYLHDFREYEAGSCGYFILADLFKPVGPIAVLQTVSRKGSRS